MHYLCSLCTCTLFQLMRAAKLCQRLSHLRSKGFRNWSAMSTHVVPQFDMNLCLSQLLSRWNFVQKGWFFLILAQILKLFFTPFCWLDLPSKWKSWAFDLVASSNPHSTVQTVGRSKLAVRDFDPKAAVMRCTMTRNIISSAGEGTKGTEQHCSQREFSWHLWGTYTESMIQQIRSDSFLLSSTQ